MSRGGEVEEFIIDLSHVPLTPISKKDIQRLEMALIIATLYSPEVLELIRDPIERATWVDSLAVAAAALARSKAGYPISKIAEEVGRSETMIRAHLGGKTKAGKLVLKTYEKLLKGELKIVIPFLAKTAAVPKEVEEKIKEYENKIEQLEKQNSELLQQIDLLKKENEELKKQLETMKDEYNSLVNEKKALEEKMENLSKENEELKSKLEHVDKVLNEIKKLLESI